MQSFPADFKIQEIALDGVTIHALVGGTGPAVLMLHGFADTGDMWAPLAARLAKTHTVVVPDLRGMGLSSQPKSIRQEDPGRGHGASSRRAEDRRGDPGHT